MARIPPGLVYDAELQLFVADVDEHEAYKRGKATNRQVNIDTTMTKEDMTSSSHPCLLASLDLTYLSLGTTG